jgi:hypothetical protein
MFGYPEDSNLVIDNIAKDSNGVKQGNTREAARTACLLHVAGPRQGRVVHWSSFVSASHYPHARSLKAP